MSWKPPRHPTPLLQELYWPDEWKILICCQLLNLTTRTQVDKIIDELFSRYPNALTMAEAEEDRLRQLLQPLGLVNKRVKTLKRFSNEYLAKDWETPKELYGCGKYADDAWRIFCRGDWRQVEPNDHALNAYYDFLEGYYT